MFNRIRSIAIPMLCLAVFLAQLPVSASAQCSSSCGGLDLRYKQDASSAIPRVSQNTLNNLRSYFSADDFNKLMGVLNYVVDAESCAAGLPYWIVDAQACAGALDYIWPIV